MRKKLLRSFTMLLSISLILAFVTGCRKNGKSEAEKIDRLPEEAYENRDLPGEYDFYSRDKITISIMAPSEAGYSDALISEIEKATNTKLDITYTTADAYPDAITKSLMSEKTMPDLYCRIPDIEYMKDQEAALPLYDLMMQYAPDYRANLTKEDWISLTDVDTYDVYSIGNIRDPKYQLCYMIRQDWLNKLDLEIPTNWDEFIDVLTRFRDDDPNGNGKRDEIPFSGEVENLRYLFGIDSSYYFCVDKDTNTYQAVVEHKNYRNYLTTVQDMYAGRLLNNSYVSAGGGSELLAIMSDNTLGCAITYAEYAQLATESLRASNVNKAEWVGFELVGPKGISAIKSAEGLVHQFCISSVTDEAKAREVMRFINWFYTEEGETLMNYGIEGKHYDKVSLADGSQKKVIKNEYANFKAAREAGMLFSSLCFHWLEDSYVQMVTANSSLSEMSIGQKCFYSCLGINGEYNFVKQDVSLNTNEWRNQIATLKRDMATFETQVITGAIDDNKLDSELTKIRNKFKEVSGAGAAVYQELYDLIG